MHTRAHNWIVYKFGHLNHKMSEFILFTSFNTLLNPFAWPIISKCNLFLFHICLFVCLLACCWTVLLFYCCYCYFSFSIFRSLCSPSLPIAPLVVPPSNSFVRPLNTCVYTMMWFISFSHFPSLFRFTNCACVCTSARARASTHIYYICWHVRCYGYGYDRYSYSCHRYCYYCCGCVTVAASTCYLTISILYIRVYTVCVDLMRMWLIE